jgi:2-hydroxy-3-oxopropionate reductase
MTAIAYVGLGTMGSPMAVNLARAGHDVRGVNRTPAKAAALVEAGGRAASLADAVDGAEVVLTNLPDSPDVRDVVLGRGGVLELVAPGTLVIDHSTVLPELARQLAAAGAERGIDVLDAPVSGGERGAIDGTLSIMVGGSTEAVKRARPLLEVVGATVTHVGPPGSGQLVKAANQLIIGATLAVVSEALVLLGAAGVDLDPAVEALSGGMAASRILERKAPLMLAGDFTPTFRAELHDKDLRIVQATAATLGIPIPAGDVAAALLRDVVAHGEGALDHAVVHRAVARRAEARSPRAAPAGDADGG